MKATSSGLVLGPVLLRGVAFVIDWLAIVVIFAAVASSFGVLDIDDRGRLENVESLVILLLTMAIYHIGFLCWRSATLGKMAMNIYVGYPDGTPLRPDTAILRFIIFLVEVIIPFGTIINFVLVFVDRDRRAIHDRVAGTIVLAGRPDAPLKPDSDQQPPSPPRI